MRKLTAFNFISINGYYKGNNEDISWHRHGKEENQYAENSLKAGNILLFGRITYEMMASYWPSPMAIENDPTVAAGMNNAEKIVFSSTLKKAEWKNTRIISKNIVDEIEVLKSSSGPDLTILGSGSIINQFTNAKLIDDYQIMIDPVALISGTSIFHQLEHQLELDLIDMKKFNSGVVLLNYSRKK